jgi:predicted phage terminase large subunit-like protein
MIPLEYEAARAYSTPWGKDPRTVEGETFWPGRFTDNVIRELKRDIVDVGIRSAQFQQDPTPKGGNVFPEEWLAKRWSNEGRVNPKTGEPYPRLPDSGVLIQSWDWVVGQVWLHHAANFYLVDQVRERADFTKTIELILGLTAKWPKAYGKVMEEKANGCAIMSHLAGKLSGMDPYNPGTDSKLTRAKAVGPFFAAGNVHLPADADWLLDYTQELTKFPRGRHDDQVDATTQAIIKLSGGLNLSEFEAAMDNLKAVPTIFGYRA